MEYKKVLFITSAVILLAIVSTTTTKQNIGFESDANQVKQYNQIEKQVA